MIMYFIKGYTYTNLLILLLIYTICVKLTHIVIKMIYFYTGELERLRRFWLAGACHMKRKRGQSSHTIGIPNFTSAFILLASGVLLGGLVLLMEHLYFKFGRRCLRKYDKNLCCSLVSLVSLCMQLVGFRKNYSLYLFSLCIHYIIYTERFTKLLVFYNLMYMYAVCFSEDSFR